MARIVGYVMLLVAALVAILVLARVSILIDLAGLDMPNRGGAMEMLFLTLCGVVVPLGLAALLLKKSK